MNTRLTPTAVLLLTLASLWAGGAPAAESKAPGGPAQADPLIIWAHSDIQPRNEKEKKYYERAIRDMRAAQPDIDLAVMVGDMVQYHNSAPQYEWLLKVRQGIPIPLWFEIAGNHEARNFANYFKYIQKPLHYRVEVGNLLIIMLSDEVNSSPTEISEAAFEWWRDLVINNQDKIIITVTHAYLEQSKLFAHWLYRSKVLGSKRFVRVLKKYRVDLWLAGHTTALPGIGRASNIVPRLGGTLFLNVSAIRRDFGVNSKSRVMTFVPGSQVLTIRTRDHQERVWEDEIHFALSHPFQTDGHPPRLIPMGGTLMPAPAAVEEGGPPAGSPSALTPASR